MSSFQERLKELREERGMTQKELGEAVGFKDANISRWENGLQDPTSKNLIKLAKFFGVSTDYLLGLVDD